MGTLAVPIVGVIASSILLRETIGINELLALGLIIPALIINLKTS
jgi:drug/metabolite transporter (DMT)-like permease